MSSIPQQPGSLALAVPITYDLEATYASATHFSHAGVGGFIELPTIESRNSIPTHPDGAMHEGGFSSGRRKLGMIVFVQETNKFYQLAPKNGSERVTLEDWQIKLGYEKVLLLDPSRNPVYDEDSGDFFSGSGNAEDAWVEVFAKTNFNTLEDLNDYINNDSSAYAGQICSVLDSDLGTSKVYLVINNQAGTGLSLQEIGGGGTGASEVFQENFIVSIEPGKTFGKYKNGDLVEAQGKTANEVIRMACLEALEPDLSFSTSSSVPFGSENVSIILNFNYIIESLGAEISELKIERKRAADSNWNIVLNDKNTSSPFTDNFIQTKYNTSLINYRFTVSDSAGGTKTIDYNVTPIPYSSPSVSSINLGSESRYRGDSSTTYIATITKNSPLVKITSYKLQRNINSGAWADVGSSIAVSTDPSTISVNIVENQSSESSLKNADTIKYRINVTDEFSSNNLTERTITFFHKCGIIYKSTDLNLNDIDSAANMTLQNTKARTISSVTASENDYVYYVYVASAGDLTSILLSDGGSNTNIFGAFQKIADISGLNSFNVSVSYRVYKSNSRSAFTNNTLSFS